MILILMFGLSTLSRIHSNTVTSPQIRILDMATKASETRLIPQSVEYPSPFRPLFRQQNRLDQNVGPLKSYVIYDDYPLIIFKEWKANPSKDFPPSAQNYLDFSRQPNAEFAPEFYRQHFMPPPKPTLAYRSVYSNVIKVFDDSFGNLDGGRFEGEEYGADIRKSQLPIDYDLIRPQQITRPQPYHDLKLPENFPTVFSPNSKFHFSSFNHKFPHPPQNFYPREGFYSTHTVNYNKEPSADGPGEVEILPEGLSQKDKIKPFLCSFIRVNQRQFPENGAPCGRSEDDFPIALPEYPDFSNLPNHKIPVEHRRQHFHMKRIKRSERNDSHGGRIKRELGFGYGYSGWGSPFSYDSGYDGYYPSREGYRNFGNNYGSHYYNNRDRNQGYRNTYYTGGRYDEYDDSNSRGLTGYLTNGGRRYEGRRNNNDDEDEENDDENDNNRESESDEEMERMNSNRRDTNGRRNNDDSRDRRRNNNNSSNNNNNNNSNNNNNDDDDYRDNRRNNNRNNSRRYNNRRNNNDRYDYNNNNRNRYYSSSNNNNNNNNGYGGYGSSYGGYGNGGYGSTYRNNGGYGYGGYGNGFGSF